MVSTALFVGAFLEGTDEWGASRASRLIKFLNYYAKIMHVLEFDEVYVSINGGTTEKIEQLMAGIPAALENKVTLINRPFIPRGKGHPIYDNLPNWRLIYDYRIPIRDGFEKLIILDDDAYILSKNLMNHIRELNSGWETVWCPKYNFPEAAFAVLCKDAMDVYLDFCKRPYQWRNANGIAVENALPYTKVNKDFKCDRWGENREPQLPWMDAYFQCPGDLDLNPEFTNVGIQP